MTSETERHIAGGSGISEPDVVIDVRPDPDSGALIVSKQKVAFSGEARLVGSPVESRVGLTARKAKVEAFGFAESGTGLLVGARVKNVGATPLTITRVAFE